MTDHTLDAQHEAIILACEKRVWAALASGDHAADDAALGPDFLGVYPDGFASKDAHLAQLANGASIQSYSLSDIRIRSLGADHALISYHAAFRRAGRSLDEAMYVSSIWQRQAGGWVNIFSQDTPAETAAD